MYVIIPSSQCNEYSIVLCHRGSKGVIVTVKICWLSMCYIQQVPAVILFPLPPPLSPHPPSLSPHPPSLSPHPSLPPSGALLGWLILKDHFGPLVYGVSFGIIAGMMVYISLKELLPTAYRFEKNTNFIVPSFLTFGMAIMALSIVLFLY